MLYRFTKKIAGGLLAGTMLFGGGLQAAAFVEADALLELNPGLFEYPTKSALSREDNKLYFNTASGVTLRVDHLGNKEFVHFNATGTGAAGIAFGDNGDLYFNDNFGTVRRLTAMQLASGDVNAEVVVPGLGALFTLGISVDNEDRIYISSILTGQIFQADLKDENPAWEVWLDSDDLRSDAADPNAGEGANSALGDLFGNGLTAFGNTDIVVDPRGDRLYIGTHTPVDSTGETGVYQVAINEDGSAGELVKLVNLPDECAANGINFDRIRREIIVSSPFCYFNNRANDGKPPEETIQTAGGLWVIDVRQMESNGYATLELIIRDPENLGNAVDAVPGIGFGPDARNVRKYLVNDGSFDTAPQWPNGANDGVIANFERMIEFQDKADHPAIRVVNLGNGKEE